MTTNVEELLTVHGNLLRQVRGEKIVDTWLVWFDEWNTVHANSPVVLQIESGHLELWTIYIAEFSLTWNTINLSEEPFSWLSQKGEGARWVNTADPLLQSAKGKTIRDISLLATDDFCNGIYLKLDDGCLVVQNQCDDLFISDSLPDEKSNIYKRNV